MAYKDVPGYCQYCEQMRMGRKYVTPHLVHLILSVCTYGVWVIVWALHALFAAASKAQCAVCGCDLVAKNFGPPRQPARRVVTEPAEPEIKVISSSGCMDSDFDNP